MSKTNNHSFSEEKRKNLLSLGFIVEQEISPGSFVFDVNIKELEEYLERLLRQFDQVFEKDS
jgi:hypothetical protein